MTRDMQRRAHGLNRLNHLEQRATETEAAQSSASVFNDSPSPSSTKMAATLPPHNTTALVAVMSVVGAAIIIGIVVWKYRSYKRRNPGATPSLVGKVTIEREYHSEKHVDLGNISIYTEKPEKAMVFPHSHDTQDAWVPQIKAYPPVEAYVALPEPTASSNSKTKSPRLQLSVNTFHEDPRSPPPSYFLANGGFVDTQSPRLIPIPPSPATSANSPPPPTPPANRRTQASFVSLSEPSPVPSPRHESFAAASADYPKDPSESPSEDSGNQKLPRLMSVATTFTPSLADELSIKVGDTVRMLDEYMDGWCLVQRVGRIDAPKGAVPRFCLQERRGVVPILPTRKYSNGSMKSGWR